MATKIRLNIIGSLLCDSSTLIVMSKLYNLTPT